MTARVSHLPVLVGVVEVLLGVLDLTHVHQHFSMNFLQKIPKISAESPHKLPNRAAKRSEPRFTEEHFAYKTRNQRIWGVGRRRAYLGAVAVFADERRRRHELQRGERVGGDGVGALGAWEWMGSVFKLK